jgi:biopolymer transport protein ExbD
MDMMARKHRRETLELQLTSMIDIFMMVVIFLIKATVFATSDMILPSDMRLPQSISKEAVESAPQLVIDKQDVKLSIMQGSAIPLSDFKQPRDVQVASLDTLKATLKDYIAKIPPENRAAGILLNVMADRTAPYADVFDVVRVFRESGFETLLFIAAADQRQPAATGGR